MNEKKKYAIRFGLGAIKSVGFSAMEVAVNERERNGLYKDVYDFSERLDPKMINKKSIEALAKSGSFDSIANNRRSIAESFDILSSHASKKHEEIHSSQLSLFGNMFDIGKNQELKKLEDWTKSERLQKEFESFGFFLNEHPIDDYLEELRKRGVLFSNKLDLDEIEDNSIVKMSGVIAGSKHRSGPRGRFAYLFISDPFGIFEATIFDESLITSARDILVDGSSITIECLIKKDDGGVRILVREIKRLDDFIKNTIPAEKDFEDIKKHISRNYGKNKTNERSQTSNQKLDNPVEKSIANLASKQAVTNNSLKITIKKTDSSEIIKNIKLILSQCLSESNNKNLSEVFLMINEKTIKLNGKYFITDHDAECLTMIDGIDCKFDSHQT